MRANTPFITIEVGVTMQVRSNRLILTVCVAVLTMQAANLWADCCNFGTILTRKKIVLQRRLPPVVSLADTSVKVLVASPQGQQTPLDAEIQAKLESILTSSDTHVTVGDAQAQYLFRASVTAYGAPKVENVTEGRATIHRGTGSMTVVFHVTNERDGHVVTSGDVRSLISRDDQATLSSIMHSIPGTSGANTVSPVSPVEVEKDLVNDVANQLASYIVNTAEPVTIYLAHGGGLDAADKVAAKSLWSQYDEQLETMSPFPAPDDDAYRHYNIGVANEAMAYQAQDGKAAKKFLQKADIEYDKALEARPTEKYFLEAQTRIVSGIKRYEGTSEKSASHDTAQRETAGERGVTGESSATPHETAMTNSDIVQMVQAKMDEANILDNIQNASEVAFDLTYPAQVQMTRSGVNGKILAAMKQRARAAAGQKPKQTANGH